MKPIYTSITPELITKDVARMLKEVEAKAKRSGLREVLDMPEVVGVLFDWEVVENDWDCGGWANHHIRQIGLTAYDPKASFGTRSGILEVTGLDWQKQIVCHEMAHAIQAEIGWFAKTSKLLSERVYEEQQAETIAWELHKILYPHSFRHPDMYTYTFQKDDHLWLYNWYGGYHENDLTP